MGRFLLKPRATKSVVSGVCRSAQFAATPAIVPPGLAVRDGLRCLGRIAGTPLSFPSASGLRVSSLTEIAAAPSTVSATFAVGEIAGRFVLSPLCAALADAAPLPLPVVGPVCLDAGGAPAAMSPRSVCAVTDVLAERPGAPSVVGAIDSVGVAPTTSRHDVLNGVVERVAIEMVAEEPDGRSVASEPAKHRATPMARRVLSPECLPEYDPMGCDSPARTGQGMVRKLADSVNPFTHPSSCSGEV